MSFKAYVVGLLLAGATIVCAQTPAAPRPDQILRGTLNAADLQSYKMLPFQVPLGTRRLTVVFSVNHLVERTVVDLGLFDPDRFRGWSGSNKTSFTLSEVDATSSYLPGALPPGTWQLVLGIPNIRSGITAEYTAEIYLSNSVDPPRVPPQQRIALSNAPGWYKGDLHAHTGQSDGNCPSMAGRKVPCPEFKVLEAAVARGLDFLAVTDHNTTSTYLSLMRWQDYFDRLLLIRGREITTFHGHTNVYGTSEWIDFRLGGSLTANQFADRVHSLGAILSLNHPAAPSGEVCMGCGWTADPAIDDRKVDAIEVVNGSEVETAFSGIPMWQERLQRGFRVTAIGGSDDHESGTRPASGRPVGTPTTVVYARELSESAVLDAIRAGHVYIKTQAPTGPDVFFSADAARQHAIMGDDLRLANSERADFAVQVLNGAGGKVEVIRDGKRTELIPEAGVSQAHEVKRFRITGDGQRHWYRINFRAADGTLVTLTNAIYENFAPR